MRIESLLLEEKKFFVGFVEVELESAITKNEILQLVQNPSNDDLEAIQLLDSKLIVDDGHILSAVQNAVNAHQGGYEKARTLDVEIAVYASGQKQISQAFEMVGISDSTRSCVVIVVGRDKNKINIHLKRLTSELGTEIEKPFAPEYERLQGIMDAFAVGDSELETYTSSSDPVERRKALSKCVVSRVSLVALES